MNKQMELQRVEKEGDEARKVGIGCIGWVEVRCLGDDGRCFVGCFLFNSF